MEMFVSNLESNMSKVTVLNETEPQQGIQVLLYPNDSIILNSLYVSYFSPDLKETSYDKKPVLDELLKQSIKNNQGLKSLDQQYEDLEKERKDIYEFKNKNFIRYSNDSKEPKYIGASKNGKVLTININLYDNIFVLHENIIGFNSNMCFYNCRSSKLFELPYLGLFRKAFDYVLIKRRKTSQDLLSLTSNPIHEVYNNSNVYLQSQGNFIN